VVVLKLVEEDLTIEDSSHVNSLIHQFNKGGVEQVSKYIAILVLANVVHN
jgi:hypothetical protein